MMHRTILSISTAAAITFAASAVQAIPLSNLDGASAPHVTLVYGGCGVYGHRGPYGGCRAGGQASFRGAYWRGPGWRFYNGCWRGPAGAIHCN